MGTESTTDPIERRQHPRTDVKFNKLFSAEAQIGDKRRRYYLYVLDISVGGMRLSSQATFPTDVSIPMRFFFEEPLDVNIQVVWQRSLDGNELTGVKFVAVDGATEQAITRMLDRFRPTEKRKSVRVDRCLKVEVELEGVRNILACTTLEIGRGGMRISAEQPLPEGQVFACHIDLEDSEPFLAVQARVSWQKPTSFDKQLIGLMFEPLEEVASDRIDRFLERAQSGLLS